MCQPLSTDLYERLSSALSRVNLQYLLLPTRLLQAKNLYKCNPLLYQACKATTYQVGLTSTDCQTVRSICERRHPMFCTIRLRSKRITCKSLGSAPKAFLPMLG